MTRAIVFSLWIVGLCACGGRSRPPRTPVSNVELGECVDPESSGVVSESPRLQRAPRDLNHDGIDELVLADRIECRGGNCFWNLFVVEGSCSRYLGTVAGKSLELTGQRGPQGFEVLRSWWKLGGDRYLIQVYGFGAGGYMLQEALVCRQEGDDRLLCAAED